MGRTHTNAAGTSQFLDKKGKVLMDWKGNEKLDDDCRGSGAFVFLPNMGFGQAGYFGLCSGTGEIGFGESWGIGRGRGGRHLVRIEEFGTEISFAGQASCELDFDRYQRDPAQAKDGRGRQSDLVLHGNSRGIPLRCQGLCRYGPKDLPGEDGPVFYPEAVQAKREKSGLAPFAEGWATSASD